MMNIPHTENEALACDNGPIVFFIGLILCSVIYAFSFIPSLDATTHGT